MRLCQRGATGARSSQHWRRRAFALTGAAAVGLAVGIAPAWAMHISDGILPLPHAIAWYVLALPFLLLGIRDFNRRKAKDPLYVPLAAMAGAAVFILSVFHIPVVLVPGAGSSSHPTGGALAAVMVGPLPAVLLNCVALLLQALFLSHGGLTSWGANTFSMGVVGVLLGYGTFRALGRARLPLWLQAGVAAALSDLVGTYGTAALQLALARHGDATVAQAWLAFMATYLPTQGPLSLLDFAIAAYMCPFIARRRPDIAVQIGLAAPPRVLDARPQPAGQG